MVKNYKKKPLNGGAANGYTPPPPTGTPLYQPDDEADLKPEPKKQIPNRTQASLSTRPPMSPTSSIPINQNMGNNMNYNRQRPMGGYSSPNSGPMNYGSNSYSSNNYGYNNMPSMPVSQPPPPPMNPMNNNFQRPYYPPPVSGPPMPRPPINNGPMFQNMNNPFYPPPNTNPGYQGQMYSNSPPPFRPPLGNSYESYNPGLSIPPRKNNYNINMNNGPTFRMPLPK